MPPINSFHHRPSIASVVREKRLKACLAQLVTDTSASSSKSLIGSSLNLKNSSIQTVPVRLQALDRKSRSRGCTRMGGLPDLNMNTCFDTLKRPPIRRLLSENLTDSAVNRSPNLNSPSTIISFEESVLETQKLSKDNIKLSAVSVTSLGRGLGEVVMTPTTEEWWSLDRLSDGSRKPDGQDELTVQGGSDGSQMGDDDEAEDLSDESGSSCSTDSFLRSSTAALTSEVQNTRVTCDSDKYLNSSGPLISPKLRHDVLSSDCKDLNPVAESSPAAALNSDPGDLSVEITSDGVHPVEPEPTIGFPTLTSVNGIIHMPPTPEDEEDLQLGNSSYKSNADLAVSSQQTNSPKDQTSSLPRSSAAILSSFLENGQLKFNSHPQTSITTRPCSLVHDGVVRKPVDPRSYSAITGYRSIHSFALDSEAGRGAYGIVKNAREKGLDGQPVGPPLIIKYIIKQKILADCWKRHKILGPIPIEIHVLDHFRRVNYRPSRVATAKKYIEDAKALGKAKELKVIPLKIDSAIPTTSPSSPTNPTSQRTGHPNICGILDYFEDPDYYYLVMPRFGGGKDLFDHVEKSPEGLKIEEVRRIFAQLVDGLAFLHERNVVHRDLKDENVILDEEGNIQLIDFGSAAYIREGMKFETFSGTLDFAAPEVLRGERHGGKEIDIWALGVLLYVLICGECPFWNPDEASRGIEAGTRAEEALRMKPEIDSLAIDLLKNCLRLEPAKRPLAEEICWHEFLVGEGGWKGSVPPTVLAPLMNEI
ncbi:kinase-like domain-containing protein [Phakopsora pachyrhizi]|uniref:Kinase-like domain-containing protein n=1 Tax=Phakopsora pachyrhizi TaxID=170000 RepID=A0AAV0BDT1_PHAPC|nr:kinase-like domain-containing protein [Phakopsora pachyrhizi]